MTFFLSEITLVITDFFSLSLSNSTRSASPKVPSEFPTPKPIPDGEILERVTSIARSMKRRRELPSQKNMVSYPSYNPKP